MKITLMFLLGVETIITPAILYGQSKCFPDPSSPKTAQFCEKYSSVHESGRGKDWSGWYKLSSDPPPTGYQLSTAAFWLQGPHPCSGTESNPKRQVDPGKDRPGGVGTYSECYQESLNSENATWTFRIQGDDSYLTGAKIVIPDIPPVTVEKNGTVFGRGLLLTRYVKRVGAINASQEELNKTLNQKTFKQK
jgi:hypothetical protein